MHIEDPLFPFGILIFMLRVFELVFLVCRSAQKSQVPT